MKTTLDEYLGRLGLSSPISDYMIDKMRIPHGMTERQQKKLEKDAKWAADEHSRNRQAAILEYQEKVKSGEIQEKSKIERMIEKANGHPDNPSVQAARRRLARLGYHEYKTELKSD